MRSKSEILLDGYRGPQRTQDEMEFLNYLGTWHNENEAKSRFSKLRNTPAGKAFNHSGCSHKVLRISLLRKYIISMRQRKDWGEINKNMIRMYAKESLREAISTVAEELLKGIHE